MCEFSEDSIVQVYHLVFITDYSFHIASHRGKQETVEPSNVEITWLFIDEEFVTNCLSMSVISEQLLELLYIFLVDHLHYWVFVFAMVPSKSIEAVLVSPKVNPWIAELWMISFIYSSLKFLFIELQMHTPLRQCLLPHAL